MNVTLPEKVLNSILEKKTQGVSSVEVDVSKLRFPEIEDIRYKLMDKGIKAEIYSEFKKTYLGVWF